jgi:alpha-ribazole phosphatase
MRLWLLRHAQPVVAEGLCYGRLDVPAQPDATAAAAQAMVQVWQAAALTPLPIWVQASPLQRCQQLAQALCGLLPHAKLSTHADLQEMDFGQWEGVAWADIPRTALDAWTADFGNHHFGGAESANAVLQRVGRLLEGARIRGQDAVWVTHAGVIRAAQLWMQGVRSLQHAQQWPQSVPAYGQWQMLEL